MAAVIKPRAYQLVWSAPEGRGQVLLYVDPDTRPEIVINVQTAADLVAWDELLGQKGMTIVNWAAQSISTIVRQIP